MNKKIWKEFYEGHCLNAYEIFGAHINEKKKGVDFTVYAPHAQSIQVIGSFNGWSCEDHMMKKIDDRGCWTCFVKGAKAGDMYKYRVTQATGRVVDKIDPFAFYSELRPNTASIIADLSYDNWKD